MKMGLKTLYDWKIVLLYFINFAQGTDNSFISLCDMMRDHRDWKRNSGYELKAWIKSITPKVNTESRTYLNSAFFEAEDKYFGAYDIISHDSGLAWRAFGLKFLDGWLYGKVDSKENFVDNQTVFIYPDFKTALLGSFTNTDDAMLEGRETRITHYRCRNGFMELKYRSPKDNSILYKPHRPYLNYISPTPLIRDPFERRAVYLAGSRIFPDMEDENESLYAKRNIPKFDLISYYNGYTVDALNYPRNYSSQYAFERYNVDFNDTTLLNLPEAHKSTRTYIATLGHKANHHFSKYNARFAFAKHPVYGEILCLKAIQHIKRGEEILLNYGYEIGEPNVPSWYMKLYLKHYNLPRLPLSDSIST